VRCTTEILGPDQEYPVDRRRLEQVLQNLLANAVNFNYRGGTVHIAVTTGGDTLQFSVQDSGKGFTEEQARRAFTKFARFSAGANQGSGLGLAIAKAFVQLHGGRIGLESKPGAGSTFHFTIAPGYQATQDHPMLTP
jgi:signal transduction histidine kinase